jgi:Fur family transcriptional regulator, ferric uptake regulator
MTKPAPSAPTLEEQCAQKGMRMTDQRRIIAQVIEQTDDHPDVEELYRRASARDPRISLSTVYRTLNLFEESGLVTKHDFKASSRSPTSTTTTSSTSAPARSSNSAMKRSRRSSS